jgi:hypothetical protein
VVAQWARYLGHVARNVGGVQIDTKYADEEGAVYAPVDADRQREAVEFIVEEGFETPRWLLDAAILSRIEAGGISDRVQRLQETALERLLDPVRIGRMAEAVWLHGEEAYAPAEMMATLNEGVWTELDRGASIDPARRSLQRAYVDRLGELINEDPASIPPQFVSQAYGYRPQDIDRSEVRPLARGALLTLAEEIEQALPRYTSASEQTERYHLLDIMARIDRIFEPEG